MENIKSVGIPFLVALVVAIGASTLMQPTPKVIDNTKTVIQKGDTVGSLTGPDTGSPYLSWGDVRNWAYRKDMAGDAASTTVCVIAAPSEASSSLRFFGWRANTGTGTVMSLKVSKSASPWVSTTQLFAASLAANTNVLAVATSTVTDSANALFGSGDYLVVTAVVSAGGAGTSSPTGVCEAQFTSI